MKQIYIVWAGSGYYDDRKDWVVKAFVSESRAKEFTDLAQKEADDLFEYHRKLEARPDLQMPIITDWKKLRSSKKLKEEYNKRVTAIVQTLEKLSKTSRYDPEAEFGDGADPIEYGYYALELDEENETQ